MTIVEFLRGPLTYVLPAPGGSIIGGGLRTNCDADLYLAEVAALIKRRDMTREEAIETLAMKIEQILGQMHYGEHEDPLLIERIRGWIRDLSN